MLELLAPAGSMESLRAAVQNGANAVYLGCGIYNARQGAKNFTPQALTEAVKYCHVRDVAVHLTLNTLVSDKETQELVQLIRHAAQSGVDAFIVQDLGVVRLCRQIAPHIPIHGFRCNDHWVLGHVASLVHLSFMRYANRFRYVSRKSFETSVFYNKSPSTFLYHFRRYQTLAYQWLNREAAIGLWLASNSSALPLTCEWSNRSFAPKSPCYFH